jgi:hypothetical protein
MLRGLAGMLAFLVSVSVQAETLILEAEVLEGSGDIELPGPTRVRYAILHHKQQKDQAGFAAWLRHHRDAHISFRTLDGASHEAVLQRLKHCFGRGLLLYTAAVRLEEKDVIRLQLSAND